MAGEPMQHGTTLAPALEGRSRTEDRSVPDIKRGQRALCAAVTPGTPHLHRRPALRCLAGCLRRPGALIRLDHPGTGLPGSKHAAGPLH